MSLVERVKQCLKTYPDFPKQGIMFRDIHSLMNEPKLRDEVLQFFVERYKDKGLTAIVGLESRGYYFGLLIASALKLPFIPVRKAGKLPGKCYMMEYGLEYAQDKIEIQVDALKASDKVIVMDDLLATGGTANAACQLVQKIGATIYEVSLLIELKDLNGRKKIPSDIPVFALVTY